MARQARQFEIMRNLIADASHQLRTPVAAMRAQAELAAEEPERERQRAIVARIHERAVGLSRLTDQLLNHALIIHRADAAPRETVDLRTVAMRTVEESDPDSARRPAARSAGGSGAVPRRRPVAGRGLQEPRQQRLRHGAAPVTIEVRAEGADAVLGVRDRGPGMPEAEWRDAGARYDRTGGGDPAERQPRARHRPAVAKAHTERCASGARRAASSRRRW